MTWVHIVGGGMSGLSLAAELASYGNLPGKVIVSEPQTIFSKNQTFSYWQSNKAENFLISKFLNFTGYKKNKIIFKKTHGWKYSYNLNGSPLKSYWNKELRLGLCADWFIGPKVENAWLSAKDLAKKIK